MIIPRILSNGSALFKEKIYVTRPNLPTHKELSPLLKKMLTKQWVTNFGDFHNELEEKIKKQLGVKYVLLCCNGTMGLFLLLKGMDLKGKVLTTPFTFPATIHAIYMAGLEPKFCDIDPDSYTLDPTSIEQNIDSSISAILGVNIFCSICDIAKLEKISSRFKIPVIYDSAHAFLSQYKGGYVGGFGEAEMFSFHATKLFTTIEGGAITTNNENLYRKLRLLINFGIKDENSVISAGLNGKMSEMNAIFGLLSLKKMDIVIKKLSILSNIYKEKLSRIAGIKLQEIKDGFMPNNQYMAIEVVAEKFGLDRNQLHQVLKYDNVITRKYFSPSAHQYDCYKEMNFARNALLPNTNIVSTRVLTLPMYASLDAKSVVNIINLIKSIQYNAKDISVKLRTIIQNS